MDEFLDLPDAAKLAKQALEKYCSQSQELTFGEWVLKTFYPNVPGYSLTNGRDFCGAQRPTDGKFYLIGMLSRGALPAQPLRNALVA